jgi:riboflavin kinase/FMN adenylyltransferase
MTSLSLSNNNIYPHVESICLGHFDGMHIAHNKIFEKLNNNSAILCIGVENSVLTPGSIRSNLTTIEIFALKLNEIKNLSAEKFFLYLFKIFPNINHIVVGYEFSMGKNKSCDVHCIKESLNNINLEVIDKIKINVISIHSFLIKDYFLFGDILN